MLLFYQYQFKNIVNIKNKMKYHFIKKLITSLIFISLAAYSKAFDGVLTRQVLQEWLPDGDLNQYVKFNLTMKNIYLIDSSTFAGLTNLEEIWLSFNKLTFILPGTFEGLISLTGLYLNDNQISIDDTSIFQNLTTLQNLDLANNNVS